MVSSSVVSSSVDFNTGDARLVVSDRWGFDEASLRAELSRDGYEASLRAELSRDGYEASPVGSGELSREGYEASPVGSVSSGGAYDASAGTPAMATTDASAAALAANAPAANKGEL